MLECLTEQRFTISLSISILLSLSIVLYISSFQTTSQWSTNSASSRTTNVSHLLFGIASSTATWADRQAYISQWWNPDTTRGFLWLEDLLPDANTSIPPYLVSSPAWNRFNDSHVRSVSRAARIIVDSFNLNLPNVRWFVMGDDDTVFFVENLASVLSNYDHNHLWYIGCNSESVEQNVRHSFSMAFGGGGFAVSFPLAQKLVGVLDGCLDRYENFYGSDERIYACIAEIGVSLSLHRGFHQFDIRGNPYGILSAHPPVPIVSLHHLESVDPLYPNMTRVDALKMAMSAYESYPRQFLQQSLCQFRGQNWSIAVSWGYTVRLYPFLLMPVQTQRPLQTFQTWSSWSVGPFTFDTQMVPSDPCLRPVVFMYDGVKATRATRATSRYKNVGILGGESCSNEAYASVLEVREILVSSEKYADLTDEPVRRRCCDMIETAWATNNKLHLHLRRCKSSDIRAGVMS